MFKSLGLFKVSNDSNRRELETNIDEINNLVNELGMIGKKVADEKTTTKLTNVNSILSGDKLTEVINKIVPSFKEDITINKAEISKSINEFYSELLEVPKNIGKLLNDMFTVFKDVRANLPKIGQGFFAPPPGVAPTPPPVTPPPEHIPIHIEPEEENTEPVKKRRKKKEDADKKTVGFLQGIYNFMKGDHVEAHRNRARGFIDSLKSLDNGDISGVMSGKLGKMLMGGVMGLLETVFGAILSGPILIPLVTGAVTALLADFTQKFGGDFASEFLARNAGLISTTLAGAGIGFAIAGPLGAIIGGVMSGFISKYLDVDGLIKKYLGENGLESASLTIRAALDSVWGLWDNTVGVLAGLFGKNLNMYWDPDVLAKKVADASTRRDELYKKLNDEILNRANLQQQLDAAMAANNQALANELLSKIEASRAESAGLQDNIDIRTKQIEQYKNDSEVLKGEEKSRFDKFMDTMNAGAMIASGHWYELLTAGQSVEDLQNQNTVIARKLTDIKANLVINKKGLEDAQKVGDDQAIQYFTDKINALTATQNELENNKNENELLIKEGKGLVEKRKNFIERFISSIEKSIDEFFNGSLASSDQDEIHKYKQNADGTYTNTATGVTMSKEDAMKEYDKTRSLPSPSISPTLLSDPTYFDQGFKSTQKMLDGLQKMTTIQTTQVNNSNVTNHSTGLITGAPRPMDNMTPWSTNR